MDGTGAYITLPERRAGTDRRRRPAYSLLVGSFLRRRRHPRRDFERHLSVVDWHDARWLVVSIGILLCSVADAILTLTLLGLGAEEANPFMQPLVHGDAAGFAAWKLGLTGGGVLALVALARLRAFGRLRVGFFLYLVLALYATLVFYELWLLERLQGLG